MSHVSAANSSYPYRGTLLRLDANGDGLLSRQELAVDQRPGLMAQSAEKQSSNAVNNGALVSLMAKLMQLPVDSRADVRLATNQSGTPTSTDADAETKASMDLYRGTYGQYAFYDMAA